MCPKNCTWSISQILNQTYCAITSPSFHEPLVQDASQTLSDSFKETKSGEDQCLWKIPIFYFPTFFFKGGLYYWDMSTVSFFMLRHLACCKLLADNWSRVEAILLQENCEKRTFLEKNLWNRFCILYVPEKKWHYKSGIKRPLCS